MSIDGPAQLMWLVNRLRSTASGICGSTSLLKTLPDFWLGGQQGTGADPRGGSRALEDAPVNLERSGLPPNENIEAATPTNDLAV
jgi:hypothetical protein